MGLDLVYDKGQTPLNDEEKEGLQLKHVSTQGELNEAEQLNVQEAVQWTRLRPYNYIYHILPCLKKFASHSHPIF